MQQSHNHRAAFTLVELAVVLSIIGILIGGIMAGKNLINSGNLQQEISLITKMKNAHYAFRKQYDGAAGDITDATDFWGTDPNGCPSNTTRTPRKETCNGNGDNAIDTSNSGTNYSEPFRAMQQLSDAGLIDGSYSGVAGSGGSKHQVAGQNVIDGPDGTGIGIWSVGPFSGNADYYDLAVMSTVIQLGRSSTGQLTTAALSPRDALNLDRKIDDSKPATGNIRAYKSTLNSGCTSADTVSATYSATTTGKRCALFYIIEAVSS